MVLYVFNGLSLNQRDSCDMVMLHTKQLNIMDQLHTDRITLNGKYSADMIPQSAVE